MEKNKKSENNNLNSISGHDFMLNSSLCSTFTNTYN